MKRTHEDYMRLAIKEAYKASARAEIPVGAVLVIDDKIIARGFNLKESKYNPCGHAEIIAITKASKRLKNWRLTGATLYVTVEPCIMCAGAILQSRIKTLVYGCDDLKAGAVNSLYRLLNDTRLNHQVEVISGILADECAGVIKEFFKDLRAKKG